MKTKGEVLLNELAALISSKGGTAEVKLETETPEPLFVLEGTLEGTDISVRIAEDNTTVMRYFKEPPHVYSLSHETAITRFFGKLGLVAEARVGRKSFDDKYIITGIKDPEAKALFSEAVCNAIDTLEPFVMLSGDITHHELVKHASQFESLSATELFETFKRLSKMHEIMVSGYTARR